MNNLFKFLLVLGISFLIVAAIYLRLDKLSVRPIHHDESLHALYGKYYHDSPKQSYYRYDPLLHGPLLYHLIPYAYHFGGQKIETARMLMACLGLAVCLLPFFLRRYFTSYSFWTTILFALCSPTLMYWSRFLREDMLILACMGLLTLGIFAFKTPWLKIMTTFLSIGLLFCTKENYVITFGLIFIYMIFEVVALKFMELEEKSVLKNLFHYIRRNWLLTLIGGFFCIFVIAFYYTAGFQYAQGFWDFLTAKGFSYWIGQHHHERLTGPFSYHFLLLSWYEWPLIIIWSVFLLLFTFEYPFALIMTYLIAGILSFGAFIAAIKFPEVNAWIGTYLKLKIGLDFPMFFFSLLVGFVGTVLLLKQNKRAQAFFFYFATSTLFAYSYAGEKVPWLSVYPLVTSLAFFVIWSKDFNFNFSLLGPMAKFPLVAVTGTILVVHLYLAYFVNFTRPGAKEELLSQVHTTPVYQNILQRIRNDVDSRAGQSTLKVLLNKDNGWPGAWFLYSKTPTYYNSHPNTYETFDIIFTTHRDSDFILMGLKEKNVLFRWWWVPDYKNMTFGNYFQYLFKRTPWNSPGEMMVSIYYKNAVANLIEN